MARLQTLTNRISQHLIIGLTIIGASFVVAVAAGLGIYLTNEQAFKGVSDKATHIQAQVTDLNHALLSEVLSTRSYLITGEEESLTSRDLSHQEAQTGLDTLKSSLASVPVLDAVDVQTLDQLHSSYDALAGELISMRKAGQTVEMTSLFDSRSDPLVLRILDTEKGLQEDLQIWLTQVDQNFTNTTHQSILLIVALLALGAITGSLAMLRFVSLPLRTVEVVERAMVSAAQSQILQPVQLSTTDKEMNTDLAQAYNLLANRQAENKASRIQFQEKLAHDMNSLLASIQGYAELVAGSHLQPGADLANIGLTLNRQSLRLGEMIQDAITATRIYEGRLEIVYRPIHLSPLLSSLVSEASQQSGRRIAYQDRIEHSFISGDSLRLREAFSKILDNALKFSPSDTLVQVTTDHGARHNSVEVLVEDHGIGISEADLPILFKPFGRIRNESTKGISGNGLSLYIARAIIEAHQGKIAVHSQPGQGTTFVVVLPLEVEG